MRLLLALGLLMFTAPIAQAQETHYTSWGGFNGLSAGWSQGIFFADSGQLWDRNGLSLAPTRSQAVRYGGIGLQTRPGSRGAFLSAGVGFYILESTTRGFDRYGYFASRYDVSFGAGGRLRLGTSVGNRASFLLTSTWLPRMQGENLPSRPMVSIGFGWNY